MYKTSSAPLFLLCNLLFLFKLQASSRGLTEISRGVHSSYVQTTSEGVLQASRDVQGRAIESIPILEYNDPLIVKAINARRLIIITDYNGTVMDKRVKDHLNLQPLISKLCETSEVVIVSRGNGKLAIEHLGMIPQIVIASDMGANVFKGGENIKRLGPAPTKQVEMIKRICENELLVIKDIQKDFVHISISNNVSDDLGESLKILSVLRPLTMFGKIVNEYLLDQMLCFWRAVFVKYWRSRNIFLRAETQNKGTFVTRYLEEALKDRNQDTYVLSIGDGKADEKVHEKINSLGYLSVVVDHSLESEAPIRKSLDGTLAQLRIQGISSAREFLNHIATERATLLEESSLHHDAREIYRKPLRMSSGHLTQRRRPQYNALSQTLMQSKLGITTLF
ncbi:hypothetical protein CROQUDRAFT_688731 [Cronartium quercuum f. sp. fusiforme G11]|uniref:Uncharacterized protein n=1 Tax=Cronartium quercuum f. sp. fusiforme G11 TaxID=708437 RepID=A0A9P6NLR2_9BASI|nr:hypothetical protein CROQUDRAFT_688731 [Cronartium quercuum f. sp. fusiforme G11]